MKAAVKAVLFRRYGGPEVLEYAELPEPVPAAGEALVEVRACSVNPVDWKLRAGLLQKFFPLEFPAVVGRDGAGVIAALEGDAQGFAVGDEVCFIAARGQGCCAERIAIKTERLARKPARIDFAQAAAFPLAGATAWIAIAEAGAVARGMNVLVHAGAGGVGGMAIQIARHLGASVVATCSAANADYVRGLGAGATSAPTTARTSPRPGPSSTSSWTASAARCTGALTRCSGRAARSSTWSRSRSRTCPRATASRRGRRSCATIRRCCARSQR